MHVRLLVVLIALVALCSSSNAQVSLTNRTLVVPSKAPSLADFLIARLRATTADQKSYVQHVVRMVEQNRLEKRLVLALERHARRKNPFFPFPVYERALRVEAAKRGVPVPSFKEIVARNGNSAAQAVRDSRIR